MYQITCDEYILHDFRLKDLVVINAVCELALNKTGSLKFSIAPTHPYYDKIKKHKSVITLYQDKKIIFRGRVLNDDVDFYNIKYVECEGELAYFLDSVQRGKKYSLDGGSENVIKQYLRLIVDEHNKQTDVSKKFLVGNVTVTVPSNTLTKISNYEDTLSLINDELLNVYGGYLSIRYDGETRYLDYLKELTNASSQVIEFGKNIIDLKQSFNGEDIYTVLIPLGQITDNNKEFDNRVSLSSLPNSTDGSITKNSDYIYDSDAIQKYGWIWRVEKWDNITSSEALLEKAKTQLKKAIKPIYSIDVSALDLHNINVDIDNINVGDKVACHSIQQNLMKVLVVNSMTIDLENPTNTTIHLTLPNEVAKDTTLTSSNRDNTKSIDNFNTNIKEGLVDWEDLNTSIQDVKDWVADNYEPSSEIGDLSNYATKDDLNATSNDLKNWTNTNYTPKTDLSAYAKIVDVNTAFNEIATAIEGV